MSDDDSLQAKVEEALKGGVGSGITGHTTLRIKAYQLVSAAFAGKMYGDEPYINHLVRIAAQFHNPTLQVIGLLHDAVEDTDITLERIYADYGPRVGDAVDALTRRKAQGESYFGAYLPRLVQNEDAWLVKVADNSENLNHSVGPDYASLRERYVRAREFLLANRPVSFRQD